MTIDQMKALAKSYGVSSFARVILSDPAKYGKALTETEIVDLMMHEARTYQKAGESLSQTFSHMFSTDTPEALLLRKAHTAIKQANSSVGTRSVSKGVSAYEQLMKKAEQLRAVEPGLSISKAFEKVYTSPDNSELAEQERRENRPVSTDYAN